MSATQIAGVKLRYAAASEPVTDDDSFRLHLPTDALRGASLTAKLERPGVMRDALMTVADVLASDLRFKARDRADYLAYLIAQGKRVSNEVWDAQKRYLAERYGESQEGAEDEGGPSPLDPVLSISEAGVALEVFSADESAYARLFIRAGAGYTAQEGAMTPGTTHLSIDDALVQGIGRMRSYRESTLEFGPGAAGEGEGAPGVSERELNVPLRWLRAFGQVQAASTLPAREFELSPIDLYNVLLTLRMRRAKTSPRALRYELVPGEAPRMILEPWEQVIEGTGPAYSGATPVVVRTWGRRRLSVLARLLPHCKGVRVRLVGAGLPAYYILDLGDAELTLALSGWTDSGWAGIATFDLLVAGEVDEAQAAGVLDELAKAGAAGGRTLAELAETTGKSIQDLRQAILHHMQRGTVVHDLGSARFQARSLLANPPSAEALRYRDPGEEQAHRLLTVEGAVTLTKVHELAGQGTRIEGEVIDAQAHRTYRSSFTLDREGRTVDATCTSPQFRRSGLREGPTVPMIALRLLFARRQAELERARGTEEGRKLIRAETRVLVRRQAPRRAVSETQDEGAANTGSLTYRVSLDEREVVVRWGTHPQHMRMHRLRFATADDARDEYFGRLSTLGDKGFIDASSAEMV